MEIEKLLKLLSEETKKEDRRKGLFSVEIGSLVFDPKSLELSLVKPFEESNSILPQFTKILCVQAGYMVSGGIGMYDITGTWRLVTCSNTMYLNFTLTSYSGNKTVRGIVIGSGSDPVTVNDYKLQTQITTVDYADTSQISVEDKGPSHKALLIYRTFNNSTSNSVEVKEVGLYCRIYSGNEYNACIDRTLYNLTIPASQTALIAYRISIFLT